MKKQKQLVKLRDDKQHLGPNQIFIAKNEFYQSEVLGLGVKSVSLQVLCQSTHEPSALKKVFTTLV
jgi:hypothetical protein